MRQFVIWGWQFLRGCWLVLGVSVAMLLFAECSVRVVRRVAGTDYPRMTIPDVYAAAGWYREYAREFNATRPQRWQSYLYFGRLPSYHGRYINIDSLGHRVTPQPVVPATPVARVFLFGGSTMWGTAQRDEHTIAAEVSHRLQLLAGRGARVAVTNFAETGYVFTQEVIDLILQLRAGQRPDVVVFYDGINDAYATVQSGVAGIPQNESKRVAEFEMGRAIDRTGFARGLRKDTHALRVLAVAALEQLALVEWFHKMFPHRSADSLLPADSAARSTVTVYAEEARMVNALARAYGFTPIFVWQPTIHGTMKRLTPFERRLRAAVERDRFQHRLQAVYRAIPPILDSAMRTVTPGRFIDASSLFRNDTSTVFVDWIGHNAESSVPEIVDAFWPALRAAVIDLRHK